ncbi:RNase adapter RapZ [Candidatus Formimonas warabiya]|uniref:RNase adaptor protein RapZ n=1 Tax=Formimonas warabiya TaxID=1761012 RepID=A0A3G1KU07_FORW1|nr:RNase adapter RapZ [Candidatus Formimonas warabiya]ATW25894.1 RNase adaptor protein RapZ [Candidatus Formimonas warabiya]
MQESKHREFQIEIITGMSGAGKSQVIHSLEDLGFYCVDNLPPTLIPKFTELISQSRGKMNKVALVMDIRGGEFFPALFEALSQLRSKEINYEIIFLEASNETLVRRFKETRRRHPLAPQGRILEGITQERIMLQELRGMADKIIDTSDLTNRQLKDQVLELFSENKQGQLSITIMSFGYKYGLPLDADLIIDVRFLPNPFYNETLRPFTGEHEQVKNFVLTHPVAKTFLRKYIGLLNFLIPHYAAEGKTHLVIAIGCTGGQHRSVTLANRIAKSLVRRGYHVSISHRDILKAGVKQE